MVDWNQVADVGLVAKGFFEIFDGATPNRFKLLQEIVIIVAADTEKFYSDTLVKKLASIGDSSTFRLVVKKTADLYDTTSPATVVKTISFFMEKMINDRVIPEAHFDGVLETEAAVNKFVHIEFNAFVTDIEDTRNPTTGVPEVVITGEIKDIIRAQRTST